MKKMMNRALSIVLALIMCVGMLSLSAFAAESTKCSDPLSLSPNGEHTWFQGICVWCQEPQNGSADVEKPDDVTKPGNVQKPENSKDDSKNDGKDDGKKGPCIGGCWYVDGKCPYCGSIQEGTDPEPSKPGGSFSPYEYHKESECTPGPWQYDENTKEHYRTCNKNDSRCPREKDMYEMNRGACTYGEMDQQGYQTCTVCGHQKSSVTVGPGGDGYCKDHEFGNTYQRGEGSHRLNCMNCSYATDWEMCDWEIEYKGGSNVAIAYVCSVCGNSKSINNVPVCDPKNPAKGHDWRVNRTELAADGKTMLTIVRCENCGAEMVDGKCDSPEGFYTLTIQYVYADGGEASKTVTGAYAKGAHYDVNSPEIDGYTADQSVVSGDMPAADLTVTVTYTADAYTLTIKYVYEDNNGLIYTYTDDVAVGEKYDVKSVEAPRGYELADSNQSSVTGTMPAKDLELTVSYKAISYTWTILYVDEQGEPMEGMETFVKTFTVNDIKSLESVTSPTKEGYTTSDAVVAAPTDIGDVTVKVVYTLSADFSLTVIHRYVALDGTVSETTEDLGKYKIGGSYATNPQNREGYTLSATPDNANGVFEAKDVTVIYVYNANEPVEQPNDNGGNTPDPIPPEPTPTPPEPPVEINEPEVPLTEEPGTEIEEPSVPKAEEPVTEIEDPGVPMADVPETGDKSLLWGCLSLISGAGLALLAMMDKKRKDAGV